MTSAESSDEINVMEENTPLLHRHRNSQIKNQIENKNWKEIGLSGLQGGKVYITFGIIILAIVFSMMTVNWTKMIYNEDETKSMMFGVLLCSISVGIISITFVLLSVFPGVRIINNLERADPISERLKLAAGVIFGLLNFFHCALFINKHIHGNSECTDKALGISYNVMSIIYTVLLIWGLFAFRIPQNTISHKLSSLGILFANFSFWLDTTFSESGDLFKYGHDHEITNKTSFTALCNYTESAANVIKDIDPLLSPCSVEFAIISIDLLFSNYNKNKNNNEANANENETDEDVSVTRERIYEGIDDENQNRWEFAEKAPILLFGLMSFSLFILAIASYIVILTDGNNNHDFFEIYICISVVLKFAMLICIMVCLVMSWGFFKYHFSLEGLILMLSCFMNVVYHMFYLFAIWKGYKEEKDDTLIFFLGISYFENIISVILAGGQTVFILAIENSDKMNGNDRKSTVYYICALLSLSNFGLWGRDSFGEAKLPALSFIIEKYYSETFWIVCTKLVLPFTIFFRIHSALLFLKMYGKRNDSHQRAAPLNAV